MIIGDSSIQLFSEHKAVEQHKVAESLVVRRGDRPAGGRRNSGTDSLVNAPRRQRTLADQIEFSHKARKSLPQRAIAEPVDEKSIATADLNIRILREMIQRLTGKIMDIRLPQDAASATVPSEQSADMPDQAAAAQTGSGLAYDYYESHYEYESTSFAAEGIITTADGMKVDFSVQLNMSREFMQEQRVSIRAEEPLQDPLAVNFSGQAVELTQTSFAFDIDMDGRTDQIAFTDPDSGFLARDINEDGVINDGSELFGPQTGDGYEELATHDDDGNGWIDKNDSIFNKLRIWMKNREGEDQLFALGEKGIGAIYLNHVRTPFSIKNDENGLLGQVRDTGLFLNENGSVGTIQQIDLAV